MIYVLGTARRMACLPIAISFSPLLLTIGVAQEPPSEHTPPASYIAEVEKAYRHANLVKDSRDKLTERMRTSMWIGTGNKQLLELARKNPNEILAWEALAWAGAGGRGLENWPRDDQSNYFEAILKRQPNDTDALAGRAWWFLLRKQYASAAQAFSDLLKVEPLHAGGALGRALSAFAIGERAEFRTAARRFLCLFNYSEHEGRSRFTPNDEAMYIRVEEFLDSITAPAKHDADYYLALGLIRRHRNFYSNDAFYKAYELAQNTDPVFAIGAGRIDEAQKQAPDSPEVLYLLSLSASGRGIGYHGQLGGDSGLGWGSRARGFYDRAVSLRPGDALFKPGAMYVSAAEGHDRMVDEQAAAKAEQAQADRESLQRTAGKILDVVAAGVTVANAIQPYTQDDLSAAVKYHGPNQCSLCAGRGRIMMRAYVESQCDICEGRGHDDDFNPCNACFSTGIAHERRGPWQSTKCPFCLGSGEFDGQFSLDQALNSDVIAIRARRAAIERVSARATETTPSSPLQNKVGSASPKISGAKQNFDQPPVLVTAGKLVYPFEMQRAGIGGQVIVRFTVQKDGTIANASIVSSTHREFEDAALSAINNSKFRPAMKNGTPVESDGQMPIAFSLREKQ